MANNDPQTGAKQLTGAAKTAAHLAGPAVQLASGAGMLRTAADAIKGAALDKLLGPTALFAGGLLGAMRAMKSIVEQSGILERGLKRIASVQQIQGKFETLLKSAEKAAERMRELYRFTSQTPFDFSDIAEGNRILQALSKGALTGADGMQMVGDAAAATGQSFTNTATQVGKLYAALKSGRSMDKVLFQLQFGGIVTDALARKLEIAEQAGSDFKTMWGLVTQELAAAEGGMKNEMKSLDGLAKRIADASAVMEKAFAEPFLDAQAKGMENTLKATQNLTPLLSRIATDSAPILKLFTSIKNEIVTATLATKGFADGLGVAWNVAKTMAVGLAASMAASSAGALIGNGRRGVKAAGSLRAAHAAAKSGPAHAAGMSRAQTLGADAAASFAAGSLGAAAALKVQSVWAAVSTSALTLHTAAMAMATRGTAGFSIAAYLGSVAVGVFTGALTLLRTVATALGGTALVALLNPLNLVLTAVAGATLGWVSHMNAVAKAAEEYNKFILTLSGVRSAMRETLKGMKDMDQYRAGVVQNDEDQKKAVDEMKALGARPGGPAPETKRAGEEWELNRHARLGARRVGPTPEMKRAGEEWDTKRAELNKHLNTLRGGRKAMDAKLGTLAPGQNERARTVDNVRADMRNADAAEQERINRASDLERRRMLQKRIQRRLSEEATGRETEAGRLNPEIFKDAPTELMKVATQIGDLQAAGEKVPERLFERQAQLNAFADTWRDMRPQIESDATEVRGINENLRGSFAGIATERLSNEAINADDPRRARILQEAGARDQKVREAIKLGLDPAQAGRDFDASVMAQARQQGPHIVADSLQSIGGGGGSAASEPMLAAQKRIEGYSAATVKILEQIRDTERGVAIK